MANANLVKKRVRMGHRDIIKFQLITESYIKRIHITDSELDCLALLGAYGEYELADFCNAIVDEKIFSNPQTVRNFLNKAEKSQLVLKNAVKGSNRKKIKLNPSFNIQTEGNIVLDYTIAYVAQKE
jgi:hypothetical protein